MANQEEKLALLEKVKEKVQVLKKLGGFRILEGVVDTKKGIRDLNPKDEARRSAFLTDEDKKQKRDKLKKELEVLKGLIATGSIEGAVNESKEKREAAGQLLKENLSNAFKNIRDLEKTYRSMDLFFRNAEEEKIRNLHFINMPLEEFSKEMSPTLREGLTQHFDANYDRFALADNYSLMIIPGYLGKNLDYMSKFVSKYRVTLVTDHEDFKEFESVEDSHEDHKLVGDDRYMANTMVTCNYGIIRKKYDGVEEEDLAIPMSVPLAGKMYSGDGIQPSAGQKHGKLDGVLGVRMPLLRSQADKIDKMGMVPIIYEKSWGGTHAMSDTTLAGESSDPDLRAIGAVRSKDWIAKVLLDYFNGLAFQKFDGELRKEIRSELNKFFKKISGYGGLLKEYTIIGPEADPDDPQRVKIGINVKPYFATKHYVIDYSGTVNQFEASEGE